MDLVKNYRCTLDDRSLAYAKDELNEEPSERQGAVETLRDWVKQQPHLVCRLDTLFLLRFLRCAKFSQLKARKMLETFTSLMGKVPEWFKNIDTREESIQKVIDIGYCLPLPGVDDEGRSVILCRLGAFNPDDKDLSPAVLVRTCMAIWEWILSQEHACVNGVITIMDFTGFTLKHFTFWGVETIKKTTLFQQKHFPARSKGTHYYNTSAIFERILSIMKTVHSNKMMDRVHLHGSNLETLYETVPMRMLPTEYLPDDYTGPNAGSIKDYAVEVRKQYTDDKIRDFILYDSSDKWVFEERKRPIEELGSEGQGSYRRLSSNE
ncbi:unnamed protein product [Owenia fusiformis]|uniref:Uncharacterized protein n=1 Tax=Owenia fusiformis TaxID=6347 RepID=A0A8J1Y7D4_OWEFU|nr:unnamed protein product [Owenia fusiformis]